MNAKKAKSLRKQQRIEADAIVRAKIEIMRERAAGAIAKNPIKGGEK